MSTTPNRSVNEPHVMCLIKPRVVPYCSSRVSAQVAVLVEEVDLAEYDNSQHTILCTHAFAWPPLN
jgi:hypothetical protein